MSEQVFDKVNDFKSARIGLASPSDIRSWSFGEVKKPETINYRTYRPEKDGLFCERIFGPERDYECGCGKYKGTKFKGIICDRCGVKVTHSRVRRKRMGHINLAASTVHIWFFKALPSRLGTLLGMKTSDLEKIIYFQDYVVLEAGDADIEGSPLEYKQVITEDQYREIRSRGGYGDFRAEMGADAVRELIEALDLHGLIEEIREGLASTRSKQKTADYAKRLKLVEQLKGSHNEPSWMVLDVVPVIPPELRPLVMLESGNFATSDLNDLYRRIINRNNRLKKLMDLNAPEVIIRNEKRMLQQAVDALFDNGRCRRPVLGSSNRPLKSITDMIKGKQGRFRENLLGKRVDYSARSVIVVGPNLKLNQCGLPKKIALELYQPFIIRRLKEQGLADTIKSAKRMLERRDEEVWDILEQVIRQHPVLLNRAPTLHRMGIQAFEPVLVEGKAITLHPLVCTGYNADFDGDQMAVHLPLSVEAQTEAHVLMLSTHNIFSPAHGNPLVSPSQDIVMGVYFLTHMDLNDNREENDLRKFRNAQEALLAYDYDQITLQEKIQVRLPRYPNVVKDEKGKIEPMPSNGRIVTTVGRILFCEILADGMPFYNCELTKKGCSRVIDDTYEIKGRAETLTLLDDMKEVGFKASTWSGISIAITDMRIPSNKQELLDGTQQKVDRVEQATAAGAITNQERHNQLLDLWSHCREELTGSLIKKIEGKKIKEIESDKRIVEEFIEIVGDIDFSSVTKKEVSHYIDVQTKLPPNRKKSPKYRDLSINEVVDMNLSQKETQTPQNINKRLSKLTVFGNWGVRQGLLINNPFSGMKFSVKKQPNKREPFTKEELRKILKPETYHSWSINFTHPFRKERVSNQMPYYWVFLLGIFSGMRTNEMCQIRVNDIKKVDKIWFMFVEDSEETKVKTENAIRKVPVHPQLIELGFIDYVGTLKKQKKGRVFWELTEDRDGFASHLSRHYNQRVLPNLGVWKKYTKVLYCTRHTFINKLYTERVDENVIKVLVGHEKGFTMKQYGGEPFTPERLLEEISKVNYSGINWKKLKI